MLGVGLHRGVSVRDYLELDALGSSRLQALALSPLHYRHALEAVIEDTAATRLGTALHMAVLEPHVFSTSYILEPDPAVIAPNNVSPRSTKAYKEACAALVENGYSILKGEEWERVAGMSAALRANPHVAGLLAKATDRELTAVWEHGGRLCRARFDMSGPGFIADLKTARPLELARFNPNVITARGYYRQAAWYADGSKRLGREVEHAFIIAVESEAPYDVGVFVVEEDLRDVGMQECEALIGRLAVCELTGEWPGIYPGLQVARVTDSLAATLYEGMEG